MRLGRFLSLCAVGARHASPCTYTQKGILRAGCGPDMSGPYSAITSDLVLQRQRDAQILELLLIDDVGGTAHGLAGVLHLREGDNVADGVLLQH